MNQNEALKKTVDNLPVEYMKAVQDMDMESQVDLIGKNFGLSKDQVTLLDQEVAYFILHISEPADFTERLAEKLRVSDDKLLQIITQVTEDILKPLEAKLEGEGGEAAAAEMPVPPPPPTSDGTPAPSYGGTSDPYREPTDE